MLLIYYYFILYGFTLYATPKENCLIIAVINCSVPLYSTQLYNNYRKRERYENKRAKQFHGYSGITIKVAKGRKNQFVAHSRRIRGLVFFEDFSSFRKGLARQRWRPAYCGSCRVFMVLGALFVRGEGSVIGTSSASLILAHRAGAWLSTIGALCKYRLQPHQLRVQLAELERARGTECSLDVAVSKILRRTRKIWP